MTRYANGAAVLAFLSLMLPLEVFGHADIEERLAALDRQIAEYPGRPEFFKKRGELHRLHRDWPAALADFHSARKLSADGDTSTIDFYEGRMWWESGQADRALPLLSAFIRRHATHVESRIVRARVYAFLGKRAAAVQDLDVAIARQQPPSPNLYLERAKLLRKSGIHYYDRALEGLDAGIDQLGPVVALAGLGIEMQRDRGNYYDALMRIDRLPESLRLLPSWLMTRGDILAARGDDAAARVAYSQALARIEALPKSRQSTRNMLSLAEELKGKLSQDAATRRQAVIPPENNRGRK